MTNIKTELQNLGAAFARTALLKNKNRDRRETHVRSLRQAMMRGEWRTTHQGIAFDEDGFLIDGQHRMMALAGMPDDFRIEMLVTTGLPRAEVWDAIDVNVQKRSVADVLGCGKELAAIATIFDTVTAGTRAQTPAIVEPFVDLIAKEAQTLLRHCGTVRKVWASASVRAAAAWLMKVKPWSQEYVLAQYAALVRADYRAMSSIVESLHRNYERNARRENPRLDLFARCVKAFDIDNRDLSRVLIRDVDTTVSEVREQILQLMPQLRQRAG